MRCWPALVIFAFLLAPATASAQHVEDTFFNSVIPSRVDHLIGFTPTTFAIHPRGQRVEPITVRVGGRTYRYTFGNAAAAVGPSANIFLRNMIQGRRYPSPQGIFLDRRLRKRERRHVRVRAQLGRDADVLAVSSGHPACASGLSRTAARGIAAGKIRTWSAAGVPTPETGDAIALRRAGSGIDRFVEPRFSAGAKLPQGARAAFDGGVGEAASGNHAIAAVTSWSRARSFQVTTCAVPIGGAAPSDASVRSLSHSDAYPISFVTLKRLRDVRPIVAAFVKYLTGPRAVESFRKRGMLLVKEAWPTLPG
jgi:PBP superfamily domain